MLKPGWDEDLRAFVKSWANPAIWLALSENIHRERWQKAEYVHLQNFGGSRVGALPTDLSREDIFNVAQGQTVDPLNTFLWVMAWGHNNASYGASRTDKIVSSPNAVTNVSQVVALTQAGNIQQAFQGLHGPFRIRLLATSFGSKIIYFVGFDPSSSNTQPLILDQLVTGALSLVIDPASGESANWNYQTKRWQHYWDYCDLVRRIRDKYVKGARIDMVEHWLWLIGGGWCWHRTAIDRNGLYPVA